MRFLKPLSTRLLAFALAFAFVPAAVPTGTPLVGASKAEAQYRYYGHHDGYGPGFHRGPGFYRPGGYYGGPRPYYGGRYYGGRRWDRDRYYHRRHNNGAAVAAGIIGLGIGAAIANSARPRYYDRPAYGGYRGGLSARDRYCLARYRSYDPYTKTYQPYNGPRRICR